MKPGSVKTLSVPSLVDQTGFCLSANAADRRHAMPRLHSPAVSNDFMSFGSAD
jgi:hypothetical protein